jgi:phytanoyl-CoA hydroxylase
MPAFDQEYSAPRGIDFSTWDKGYVHIEGFFSPERVEAMRAELDRLWDMRQQLDNPYVIDVFIGTPRERRVLFRSAPDEARKHPYKLNDLFLDNEIIQGAVLDPRLVDTLRYLLQSNPVACNTLTLEYGSQQRMHFDTFYMPPVTENKLIASWVALDPVRPENGPLRYVPGSHKTKPYIFSGGTTHAKPEEMPQFDSYIESALAAEKLEVIDLTAEPGDLFIWHAQLYHGGAPIIDRSITRRSIVTHYFSAADVGDRDRKDLGGGRLILKRDHQPAQDW